MNNDNSNINYLFQKHYYRNRDSENLMLDWSKIDDKKQDKNEDFFKIKNSEICAAKLQNVSTISVPKEQTLELETLYPGLFYGAGITHEVGAIGEVKLGFQLDHTTGMPVIMGSSVKGAIRAYFPQFQKGDDFLPLLDAKILAQKNKSKEAKEVKEANEAMRLERKKQYALYIAEVLKWIDEAQKKDLQEKHISDKDVTQICQKVHLLEWAIFEGIDPTSHSPLSIYKRDVFYEAVPTKTTKGLMGMDFITPHIKQDMSYQKAMLKNPTPLAFLKVIPLVSYEFQFGFHATTFDQTTISIQNKIDLVKEILTTFGIGAKTNVGYGQLKSGKEGMPTPVKQVNQDLEKIKAAVNATPIYSSKIDSMDKEYVHFSVDMGEITLSLKKKISKVVGANPQIGSELKVVFSNQVHSIDNLPFTVTLV